MFRVRSNQNGNLLSSLPNQGYEVRVIFWRGCKAVGDEGALHQRWIEFDHTVAGRNHRTRLFGCVGDATEASAHGPDRARADEGSGSRFRISPLPCRDGLVGRWRETWR